MTSNTTSSLAIALAANNPTGATGPIKDSTMKQHTETLLDYLTAIAIGVGLAACLFYGWSA